MGGGEECTEVWWGKLKERDHLAEPSVDGKNNNIVIELKEMECWGMDWIELAQARDRWRVLVPAVMKLRVP